MNIMLMLNCLNFLSLVKNCNHKRLGLYYILSALIFGISGTLLSLIIRVELYSSGNRIIPPENQNIYNVTITLHGLIMIFFLVMPSLFGGFGNYFSVIYQGSNEIIFPRINNFSILLLVFSYVILSFSLVSEYGAGTGWTLYPPLSTSFLSLSPSSMYFLLTGLLVSGLSSALRYSSIKMLSIPCPQSIDTSLYVYSLYSSIHQLRNGSKQKHLETILRKIELFVGDH